MPLNRLIDPPSPYASLEDWKVFLSEMRRLAATGENVQEYIKLAEQTISDLERQ